MPDQIYHIRLQDGRTEQWDQQQYEKASDKLMQKYPDAEIVRGSLYNPETDTDIDELDAFQVSLPDGRTESWDKSQIESSYQNLMSKYPQAMVFRFKPVGKKADDYRQQMSNQKVVDSLHGVLETEEAGDDKAQALWTRMNDMQSRLDSYNKQTTEVLGAIPTQRARIIEQSKREKVRADLEHELNNATKDYFSHPSIKDKYEKGAKLAKDSNAELEEVFAPIAEEIKERNKTGNSYLVMSGNAGIGGNSSEESHDLSLYEAAKRLNNDTLRTYEAPSKYGDERGIDNFMKGAVDRVSQLDFWTMGLSGLADQYQLNGVLNKIRTEIGGIKNLTEENIEEKLTPLEKQLLAAFFRNADAKAARAMDLSRGYQAGQSAADSLQFMAQFALSGGIAGGVLEGITGKSVESMSKFIAKLIAGNTDNVLAKAGARLAGDLAETLVMMPAQPGTYKAILEAKNALDESGELVDPKEGWKGFFNQLIEVGSEHMGDYLGNALGAGAKAVGADKYLKKLGETKWGRYGAAFYNSAQLKGLRAGGWHNGFGEMEEEFIGAALRSLTGLDPDAWKEQWKGENIGIMALSFLPMTLYGGVVNTAKYGYAQKDFDNKRSDIYNRLESLGFSKDQIDYSLDASRMASPEDIMSTIKPVVGEMIKRGATKADTDALADFALASAKLSVYDGFEAEKVKEERANTLNTFEEAFGQFWQEPEEGERIVQMVALPDGTGGFVKSVDSATGEIIFIGEDGKPHFTKESVGARLTTETMNQFLDRVNLDQKKKADEERMRDEEASAENEFQNKVTNNEVVPLGPKEDQQAGALSLVPDENGNVVPERDQEGNYFVITPEGEKVATSKDDLAKKWGIELHPKTEEQIAVEELDELSKAMDRRNQYNKINPGTLVKAKLEGIDEPVEYEFLYAQYNEDTGTIDIAVRDPEDTENNGEKFIPESAFLGLEQTAATFSQEKEEAQEENANQVPLDYRGKPLPIDSDGKVDEDALWNDSPEAWALWNDEQRKDGGQNSINYINLIKRKLEKEKAALQTQYDNTTGHKDRAKLEEQMLEKDGEIKKMDDLLFGYTERAEAAKKAEEEAAKMKVESESSEPVQEAEIASETSEEVTPEQEQAIAEEERRIPLRARANDWAAKTGVDVEIYESADQVQNEAAKKAISEGKIVKGWYDKGSGKVYLYIPGIEDEADVDKTYIHEVISHKGLSEMLGAFYPSLLDRVWDEVMDGAAKEKFTNYVKMTSPNAEGKALQHAAADEYIAFLSENVDVDEYKTAWEKVVNAIRTFLVRMLTGDLALTNDDLSDLIRASMARYRDIVANGEAEPVMMRKKMSTESLPKGIQKEMDEKGLVMEGGAVMDKEQARLKEEAGYKTPVEKDDDGSPIVGDVRFSYTTMPAWRRNYLSMPGSKEHVVKVLENFAERTAVDELVRNVVPGGVYKYGEKASGSKAGPLRTNIEYIVTFDMDTSCPRTLQYLAFSREIEKRIGRPLTMTESIQLIEMMRIYGQMIPCVYCYCENKRQALKQYYTDFMTSRHAVISAKTEADALKAMYGHKTNADGNSTDPAVALNEAAYKVFQAWRGERQYNPSLKQLWAQYGNDRNVILSVLDDMFSSGAVDTGMKDERIAEIACKDLDITDKMAAKAVEDIVSEWKWNRIEDRSHDDFTRIDDEDDRVIDQRTLSVWREMTAYGKSASQAKNVLRYVPYTDELKTLSQEERNYINGMGGLRMHSSNDFRIDYVLDYFQFMADMAVNGMYGHTYTKSPEFVRIFGNSGYKINMSIAAYEDSRGVRPNPDEGFDWKMAQEFRKLFPNAGTMFMATSDAQVQFALDNDWIDMCIPFHASSLPKEVWYSMRAWQDYSSVQNERFLNADDMRAALKEGGVEIPKGAKAAEIEKLYNNHFNVKVVKYQTGKKKGKKFPPHFLPGPTIVDGVEIPGHNNDYNEYMRLCREYGVKPRFYGMKVRDNTPDGGGRLIDITEHPRYMIFIKETSRTDTPQTPIEFNFDQPSEALGGKSPIDYAFDELQSRAMAESEMAGHPVDDIYESYKQDPYGIVDQFINGIIKHKETTGKDYPLDYLTPDSRKWFMTERRALEDAYKDFDTIPYHPHEYDEDGNLIMAPEDQEQPDTAEGEKALNDILAAIGKKEEGGMTDEAKARKAEYEKEKEAVDNIRFRIVQDPLKVAELEAKPKVKVYRSMQLIDGKLYPPMSAKVEGELRQPAELGIWEESEENPSIADEDGNFKLDKGNGKSLDAAYAPYFHTRRSPLNEQFSEAYNRPNLVIVEGEIPESELTSGYTAEKSKKSTGEHDWPSGKVSNALAKQGQDTRKVILSRWFKPIRVVPNSEVADMIMERVGDSDIAFPNNVVTPELREELKKRGAKFEGWQGNKPKDWEKIVSDMDKESEDNGIRFSIRGLEGVKNAEDAIAMDNLETAEEMEKAGKDSRTIWMATGWERGADGKWRNEIPDAKPKDVDLQAKNVAGNILDAPELFKSYPQIESMPIIVKKLPLNIGGRYMRKDKLIELNENLTIKVEGGKHKLNDFGYSALLHEIQHAIQDIDGFARGSSDLALELEYYRDVAKKDNQLANFAWLLLSRARNTQKRLIDAGRETVIKQAENIDESKHDEWSVNAIKSLGEYLKTITDADYKKMVRNAAKVVRDAKKESEKYERVAGEVEARNVQERNHMNEDLRKEIPLSASEDTKRKDQIVMFRMSNANQRIFISNAENAVGKIKMEKATPEQWKKMLEKEGGLKAGEDKWLGLSEWLDASDRKTLTKDEVAAFIAENKIQIEEQHYSEDVDIAQAHRDDIQDTIGHGKSLEELQAEIDGFKDSWKEIGEEVPEDEMDERLLEAMKDQYGDDFEMGYYIVDGRVEYQDDPWDYEEDEVNKTLETRAINATRKGYTTEGLENLHEIALTVPTIESWNESDQIHFGDAGEGRAISWARFGDTTVSDEQNEAEERFHEAEKKAKDYRDEIVAKYALEATGTKTTKDLASPEETAKLKELQMEAQRLYKAWKYGQHKKDKVLVIDEIQSKRHQEAREQGGYKDDTLLKQAEAKRDAAKKAYDDYHNALLDKYGNFNEMRDKITPEENEESNRLYQEFRRYENAVARNGFDPQADEVYRDLMAKMREVDNNPELRKLYQQFDVAAKDVRAVMEEERDTLKWALMSREEQALKAKEANAARARMNSIDKAMRPYREQTRELQHMLDERERELADAFNQEHKSKIPAAPFEKNWPELTMKRMLRYAAEGGYKYMAWTTGEQQAERYNIGQVLNRIEAGAWETNIGDVYDEDSKTITLYTKSGQFSIDVNREGKVLGSDLAEFDDKQLSDIVGKELAVKILTDENGGDYSGDQQLIGGQGMKGFYDEILPRWMNKYAKQWGVKVEDIKLPWLTGEDGKMGITMHSVPITDEMRESVMEGQLMFRITPEQDAEYDEAVKNGDNEKVKEMVISAAKAVMPNTKVVDKKGNPKVVYHGTISRERFNEFKNGDIYMVSKPWHAEQYTHVRGILGVLPDRRGRVMPVFVNLENPLIMDANKRLWRNLIAPWPQDGVVSTEDVANYARSHGYDGVIIKNVRDNMFDDDRTYADDIIAFDSSQVKSAGAIYKVVENWHYPWEKYDDVETEIGPTYDDEGNLIPLSERFNKGIGDIRFKLGVDEQLSAADAISRVQGNGLMGIMDKPLVDQYFQTAYSMMPEGDRKEIARQAMAKDLNFRRPVRDYIADLAKKGYENDESGLLRQLATFISAAIPNHEPFTWDQLLYMMWRDANRYGKNNLLSMAEDISIRRKLGVGEFAKPFPGEAEAIEKEAEQNVDAADIIRSEERQEAIKDVKKERTAPWEAINRAMGSQRQYDRATVDGIVDLAKQMIREGNISGVTAREMGRLMTIIKSTNGRRPETVKNCCKQLMDFMIDHTIQSEEDQLEKLLKVKGTKAKAPGVDVMTKLDVRTQGILNAFKENMGQDETTINNKMADIRDKMSSDRTSETRKEELQAELDGLTLALQYATQIAQNEADNAALRDAIKNARADFKDLSEEERKQMEKAYREYYDACYDEIRRNKIERVNAYRDLNAALSDAISEGKERARSFLEAERERINQIHHYANSDLQGVPATKASQREKKGFIPTMGRLAHLLASPLANGEQIFRTLGRRSPDGRGYLYQYFVPRIMQASDNQKIGEDEAFATINAKLQEIYDDPHMNLRDLYLKTRRGPKATISYMDGSGKMIEEELGRGQLLYIYMVDKMPDGRMKLREMGITEDQVRSIRDSLDPKLIEFADWVQEDFLSNLRDKYNEVHKRMFGTSMAAIENYFPLKIAGGAIHQEVDVNGNDPATLASTLTGAIIKRRVNTKQLDLVNADAFMVLSDHITEMEEWAAYAEVRKDINTLLSYDRFRNQVKHLKTVFGTNEELWRMVVNTLTLSVNKYNGKGKEADDAVLNAAKAVSAAKVNFRVYTALKQFLSFPAYITDTSPEYLAKSMATPWESWKWAMENLPSFKKRWQSGTIGNEKLEKSDADWEFWETKFGRFILKDGMLPNRAVDALTVSIGAKAIYDTKKRQYIKEGFSEERADKKAKTDAEVLFNATQQSSESLFLSTLQKDRTVLSNIVTVFRNASMGYQRQLHQAIRSYGRIIGHKQENIDFLTKQLVREGLDEDQAKKVAKQRVYRLLINNGVRIATFGFLLQFAWNLGSHMVYLLFGDDDDKKNEMLEEDLLRAGMGGMLEGFAGGNAVSEALYLIKNHENLFGRDFLQLPLVSDMKNLLGHLMTDPVRAANDLVNLAFQIGMGSNPQVVSDAIIAIIDACDGDVKIANEALFCILRIIQVPQSQLDELMIDEIGMTAGDARKLSYEEIARRYTDYRMNRDAAMTKWAYSDELRENREKEHQKTFKEKYNARKKLKEQE